MMRAAVVRCAGYAQEEVYAAVQRAVELAGGLAGIAPPGGTVFIKANLMRKSAPDLAVVTHPAVTGAVARLCREAGYGVIIGDSPGGPYTRPALEGIYAATGYKRMAEEVGAALNYDCSQETVEFSRHKVMRECPVIAPLLRADAVINVCKLKSHTLTVMTGAVKNLYGAIPGLIKAEYHYRYQTREAFADMLVDIAENIAPAMNIVDAVVCMEGDGPGTGSPRKLGAIVASQSAVAADMAAAQLVGFGVEEVPVLAAAMARGLVSEAGPELAGDSIEELALHDFVRAVSRDNLLQKRCPGPLQGIVQKCLTTRPKIDAARCVGCGICKRTCPVDTIVLRDGKARIVPKACIRCFCCMEFCPEKAVLAQRGFVLRMAMLLTEGKK